MKVRDATATAGGASAAPPSKTRRKKAMHELQSLGEELARIDARKLATLDLPERLIEAIELARVTTRHEAKRRQMQYIGRLMRDIDPQPIRAALDAWAHGPREEQARFAALEGWRQRLLDDSGALAAFLHEYADADAAVLGRLIDEARSERGTHGPPHRQRALFRMLREIVGRHDDPERS
jgi:ribosome-associated protein